MKKVFKRTCQLGLLAKDMLLAKYKKKESPARTQVLVQVVERLGLMHGVAQKVGQLLSFSELEDSAPVFTTLTENKPTLPAEEAFAAIEDELGSHLEDCFEWLDQEGISASIGQVHRAVLLDGREAAVKIQYPGVAEQVMWDLKALGWLSMPVGNLRRGFNMARYRGEIGARLAEELDYRHEAEMLKRISGEIGGWDDVAVPEVLEDLSGSRILTTTWLIGERFSDVLEWPEDLREEVAEILLKLFFAGCFKWGFLHADPHPGNYRFRQEKDRAVVGILDFGCMKSVDGALAEGLEGLIWDAVGHHLESERVWERCLQIGFDPELLAPIKWRLPRVMKVLLEPFLSEEPFYAKQWNLSERVAAILGPERMALRLAGPPEMIFIIRAFQGMVQYLKALDVEMDWRRVFIETVGERETVERDKGESVGGKKRQEDRKRGEERTMKSECLRIQVTEANETRVDLTFNVAATDNLPDLVPTDLKDKLDRRAIILADIARTARQRDYAPGELFCLEDGSKKVRVWLE